MSYCNIIVGFADNEKIYCTYIIDIIDSIKHITESMELLIVWKISI